MKDTFGELQGTNGTDELLLTAQGVQFEDEPQALKPAAARYANLSDVAEAFAGMEEGGAFPVHSPATPGELPLY